MAEVYEDVDEAITDLPGSPTTEQVVLGTRDFSARELAAAAARRALVAGGGGGAVDSVTAANATITIAGTGADPTVAVTANTFQPLDSDLTAIAALSTTAYGRSLLALADQAALQAEAGGGGGGGADPYDPLGYGMALNVRMDNLAMTAGTWAAANFAFFWRLINGKEGATGIRISVQVQSGNLSFALYENTGVGPSAVPGTLIVATGSIACPAVGVPTVSLGGTFDVPAGSWLGMSCNNTTASFERNFNGVAVSNIAAGLGGYQSTGHPLSGSSPAFDAACFSGGALLQVV